MFFVCLYQTLYFNKIINIDKEILYLTLSFKGFYFDPKKYSKLYSKSHKIVKKYNKKDSKICHTKKPFFSKMVCLRTLI